MTAERETPTMRDVTPPSRSPLTPPTAAAPATSNGTPILTHGLDVRYGKQEVLTDLGLAVPTGSVYALLGRNGAGKSSLVRCLLGCQRPSAGEVRLLGRDVWRERVAVMARVGVVPETPDAPPRMTAVELGRFCSRLYPRWQGARFEEQLKRFTIPRQTPFGRLSRGQKTQVGIALALAHEPELLILDDPTLGLDAVARRAVLEELVLELADRGTTVFLTTHDLAGIERIASRIGILHGGRLLVDEDLDTLKARFRRATWTGPRDVPRDAAFWLPPAAAVELGALATRATPWGETAVLSRFDPELLRAALGGGPEPQVEALDLDAIFVALTAPELLVPTTIPPKSVEVAA